MTDAPQLLLAHHLKALKLPRSCASTTSSLGSAPPRASIISHHHDDERPCLAPATGSAWVTSVSRLNPYLASFAAGAFIQFPRVAPGQL
jgi:hypothetical protein